MRRGSKTLVTPLSAEPARCTIANASFPTVNLSVALAPGARVAVRPTARAENRRFCMLSALHAHTKCQTDRFTRGNAKDA